MIILLWLMIPAVLILTLSLVLSFSFTRRYYLFETRGPAELGLPFENVAFPSADGLTLRGWWIPKSGVFRKSGMVKPARFIRKNTTNG